jgi:hypothetical protein
MWTQLPKQERPPRPAPMRPSRVNPPKPPEPTRPPAPDSASTRLTRGSLRTSSICRDGISRSGRKTAPRAHVSEPGRSRRRAQAARALRLESGSTFNPTCGVNPGDPVHNDRIRFVGILGPTGTPHDCAVYIPLATFYTLSRSSGPAAHKEHGVLAGFAVRGGPHHSISLAGCSIYEPGIPQPPADFLTVKAVMVHTG